MQTKRQCALLSKAIQFSCLAITDAIVFHVRRITWFAIKHLINDIVSNVIVRNSGWECILCKQLLFPFSFTIISTFATALLSLQLHAAWIWRDHSFRRCPLKWLFHKNRCKSHLRKKKKQSENRSRQKI